MVQILAEGVFRGHTVFVAGGSSGINLAIAQAFAAQGAKVAAISRSQDKITAATRGLTAAGCTAMGMVADVRDFDAVDRALAATRAAYGEIDVVISGAAGNFLAPALGMSANAFKTVIDIDLIGTFNVLRASFQYLKKPGASLISITAPQGKRASLLQAHASAAKAGVNMLTQCLAMEWGPAGVRVNAISPGPIGDTEGMARLAPTAEVTSKVKQRLALRDYGTKQDIADLALFLASDNSKYITGTIIECDGGCTLGDASGDIVNVQPRHPTSAAGKLGAARS